MAHNNVLHWLDGRGWLVLSGGQDETSQVRAQAIGRAAADGGVAYVSFGGAASGELALDDMEDLGAPAGYIVDLLSEDDPTIVSRLSEAGMIVVEGGVSADDARSSLMGAAVGGMRAAFENGALILAEGTSAMVFGRWVIVDSGKLLSGVEWLRNALVIPGVSSASQSNDARDLLAAESTAIVLSIGVGSALALGPDGQVETWGRKQVSVALGRDYRS